MAKISVLTFLVGMSLLLLSITFNLSVFASVSSSAYVDSNNQFSINPPSGWTVDSSGAYGTAVILYGPVDSNFRINMNILVQATTMSLSAYVSSAKSQLAASLTNYALVSEGSTTIGGVAAYQLVNTFTQGSYNIKDSQYILVQNQKAYIITSTALQSNYATYQPSFDESAQTFKLTAPAPVPAFPWLLVIVGVAISAGLVAGLTIFFVKRMGRGTVAPEEIPPSSPSAPPS